MWEFVESVRGISEACETITLKENPDHATPIIAGNVSFYNESKNGSIPPSPIISCLGRIKNINNIIPAYFQKQESAIIMIGERKNELGGSAYYSLFDELGANVPKPNLDEVKNQIFALTDCIEDRLILSCHDISDGGLASAISEMTFYNEIGCKVDIQSILSNDAILFSETGGFLLEVKPNNVTTLESVFSNYGLNIFNIGRTFGSSIIINDLVDIFVTEAKKAWKNGLRDKL